AHLLLSVRAPGLKDAERYAASMVGVILGDGSSSKLYKSVREKDGLAYTIYSYGSAYADSGILGVYACTAINDADKAEARILQTIEDFVKNGPTKEEVARGKAQLKAGIVFSLENLWDRASLFARDELYYRERSDVSEMLNSIEKVTDIDIAEAARKYLTKDGVTSLKIVPQKYNAGRRSRRLRRTSFGTRKEK
ncbi:MAG: insulinase family protein, partial [Candidatus Kryptoniota bacterium]